MTATAAKPAGPVKPSVTGTFKGNGKPAKLAFVSARPGEEVAGLGHTRAAPTCPTIVRQRPRP